jgi:hypothetical protein
MKIGGEYRIRGIGPRQWRKLATDLRLDKDRLVTRINDLASALPDAMPDGASGWNRSSTCRTPLRPAAGQSAEVRESSIGDDVVRT